ncbi:MAG: 4'-phosphopantetheinyl transferase superfamily protein [Pedobacter sp.]|uniref:4'-phosphopantetheinyl transferase family protein n=1 Tax=Pedobacter sp. TaxID=1411316 RepID=UPI00339A80B3
MSDYSVTGEGIPQLRETGSPDSSEGRINIWVIDINSQLPVLASYVQILTAEEMSYAARFHQKKDAQQFIITRAILKILLADTLTVEPREIHITQAKNKKPVLAEHQEIHFNVSHSDNQAVIAIARQRIGIDVEFVKPNFDYQSVADYTFSDEESDYLKQSASPRQEFFRLWTRKEAFLKGMGSGLINELNTISCMPEGDKIPVKINGLTSNWELTTIDINSGYIMSIAFEPSAAGNQIFLFDFSQAAL